MPRKNGDNKPRIIVVRRGRGGGGGHHGGAWKIAYADFVTAMMAFFLVMWLINATTEQRRRGIANFFNPMAGRGEAAAQTLSEPGTSTSSTKGDTRDAKSTAGTSLNAPQETKSEAGRRVVLGAGPGKGGEPVKSGGFGPDMATVVGSKASGSGKDAQLLGNFHTPVPAFPDQSLGKTVSIPPALARIVPIGGQKNGQTRALGDGGKPDEVGAAMAEQQALQQEARQLAEAVRNDAQVAQLAPQVAVDVVPQGLRIQLSESDHEPMFETGSAKLNARAQHLLKLIAPYLIAMPQTLSIYGYTDGALYRKKGASNWTLSSERADAARAVLSDSGFPEQRLAEVVGRGARDLAVPDDPDAAANRRVVLLLHRDHEVKLPDRQDAVLKDGVPSAGSAQTTEPATTEQ